MKRQPSLVIFLLGLFVLSGCNTIEDFGAFFQSYERDFKKRNPYVAHRVPRDSYSLHAREFGRERQNDGPPIILMHGFPDSLHLYDLVVPYLSKSRRVIAFDFLGWGASDKPEKHRYDVASLRRDLEAVVRHFKIDRPVLVVHDSSGQPGIDWALENRERVSSLILLNTYYHLMKTLKAPEAIELYSTPGLWRDIMVFAAKRSDSRYRSGVMDQLRKFVANREARDVFLKLFAHQAPGSRRAFFKLNEVLTEEVRNRETKIPELKKFNRPVRIIFGAEDPYLNAGVAREFDEIFPDSELFLIQDAYHYVQLDKPAEVARLILSAPR